MRFVEGLVTGCWEFEKWWRDEYEFSERYWAKGPVRCSEDGSSEEDDERECEWVEAMEAWERCEFREDDEGVGGGDLGRDDQL